MTLRLDNIELHYFDEIFTITVKNECGDCAAAPFNPDELVRACLVLKVASAEDDETQSDYDNALDDVLKIIDEVANDDLIDDAIKINSVRNRVVMWLKGGEQE